MLNILKGRKGKGHGLDDEFVHQLSSAERSRALVFIEVLKTLYEGDIEKALSMLGLFIDSGVLATWEYLQEVKEGNYDGDISILNTIKEFRQKYPRVISTQLDGEEIRKRAEIDKILEHLLALEQSSGQGLWREAMSKIEDEREAITSPAYMNKLDKKASAIQSASILGALHEGKKEKALSLLDLFIGGAVVSSLQHLQETDKEEVDLFLQNFQDLRNKYPRILLDELGNEKKYSEEDDIIEALDNLKKNNDLIHDKIKDYGRDTEFIYNLSSSERNRAMEFIEVLKAIYKGDNEKALSLLDLSMDSGILAAWEYLQTVKKGNYDGDLFFLKTIKGIRQKYPRVISTQLDGEEMQKRVEMAAEVDKALKILGNMEQ